MSQATNGLSGYGQNLELVSGSAGYIFEIVYQLELRAMCSREVIAWFFNKAKENCKRSVKEQNE